MVEEIRDLRRRYKRAERILLAVGAEEGEETVRALRRGDTYEEIERGLGCGRPLHEKRMLASSYGGVVGDGEGEGSCDGMVG